MCLGGSVQRCVRGSSGVCPFQAGPCAGPQTIVPRVIPLCLGARILGPSSRVRGCGGIGCWRVYRLLQRPWWVLWCGCMGLVGALVWVHGLGGCFGVGAWVLCCGCMGALLWVHECFGVGAWVLCCGCMDGMRVTWGWRVCGCGGVRVHLGCGYVGAPAGGCMGAPWRVNGWRVCPGVCLRARHVRRFARAWLRMGGCAWVGCVWAGCVWVRAAHWRVCVCTLRVCEHIGVCMSARHVRPSVAARPIRRHANPRVLAS